MGNALQFNSKFNRIAEYNTKQNYQSIWLEYGDLVYLIWTFDAVNAGSYDSIMETLSEFIEKWELMDPDQPVHQMVKATGLPIVTSAIQSLAADFDKFMKNTGKDIENFFEGLRERARVARDIRQ